MSQTISFESWLIAVGRKLRLLEGDHMVASTKLVKAIRPLAAMYARGEATGYAAHIVSQETEFAGEGDYSQ